MKAALLLSGLMVFILASSLLSSYTMGRVDQSFSSMYADRLIPAIDMIYLTENLYRKRLLVEGYLLRDRQASFGAVAAELAGHNQKIDSLIDAFGKTYLVQAELKSLNQFQHRINEYAGLEKTILTLHEAGRRQEAIQLFERQGSTLFQQTIIRLNELTQIQSTVGEELFRNSHSSVLQSEFFSRLQLLTVLIIGVMVLALIKGAQLIGKKDSQPFHLN